MTKNLCTVAVALAALAAPVFAQTGTPVTPPAPGTVYNGFSRGYSFTALSNFFIQDTELDATAYQAGDTGSVRVSINGTEVFYSVGTAPGANGNALMTPPGPLQVFTGDLVEVIANWSPAVTGNFSAHNSYGSGGGTYATPVEGQSTILYRAGVQWDIGDPGYAAATTFNSLSGSIGRSFIYTTPPAGLFASFDANPSSGASPLTVTFTDTTYTSDPGGVTSWAWDFDGDGVADATTPTATWVYGACGSYDVTLTVTDATHPPSATTVVGAVVAGGTASLLSEVTTTMPAGASLPFDLRDHAVSPLPSGGALVFGGEGSTGPNYSTYTLNSGVWTQQFPFFSPAVRRGHAMALDELQQHSVLFGGTNPAGVKMLDTWTYAGGAWVYQTPSSVPSARSKHAMAFDALSGSVILMGGEDDLGAALSDMWSWDGANWTEITPSTLPTARYGHGRAFDRFRDRLVLFGGTDGTHRLDDTWEWDGADWALACAGVWRPDARDGCVMAYDMRSEGVVMIGGETDSGCTTDVWSWRGTGWTRHDPVPGSSVPSPRRDAAIYVETNSGEVRMIGGGCGSSYMSDLWEYQLPVFSRTEVIGVGCAGSNGVPTLSIASGEPVLGTSVDFLYTNALNSPFVTPAIVAVGFNQDVYQGLPLPLPLAVIGLPGCSLYHSNDLSFSVGVAPNTAQFTWTLPIPTSTSYLGQEWFVQGLHLEFPGAGSWAAMSNAVGIRIGDQ